MNRLIVTALLLCSLPGLAFEVVHTQSGLPVSWKEAVTLVLDPATSVHLGEPRLEAGVRAAIATLNQETNQVQMSLAMAENLAPGFDAQGKNQNDIIALDEWPFDESWVATTRLTLNARTGEIIDADILLNAEFVTFRVLPGAEQTTERRHDVQNTLTHELGHLLGLAHNAADTHVVMYPTALPGEISKRTLADDDRAGLKSLYSAVSDAGTPPPPTVGCSAAPSVMPMLALVLFGLLARRRAAVLLLALPVLAQASEPLPRVPDLKRAEAVVAGRVVSTASRQTAGVIVTEVTVEKVQCLVEPCAERFTLTVQGGRVGDIEQVIIGAPVPQQGEAVVVTRADRRLKLFRLEDERVLRLVDDAIAAAGLKTLVPSLRCAPSVTR